MFVFHYFFMNEVAICNALITFCWHYCATCLIIWMYCIYDHKNKSTCQLEAGPWFSCQSIVLDPAHAVLNLMSSAFSHFKASGVPLTVNLQPWLVATGIYPRNPPVANALLIRPSRWDRGAPWEARTTVPYMAHALSASGAHRVTHSHPLNPDGCPPPHPPNTLPPPSFCAPLLPLLRVPNRVAS